MLTIASKEGRPISVQFEKFSLSAVDPMMVKDKNLTLNYIEEWAIRRINDKDLFLKTVNFIGEKVSSLSMTLAEVYSLLKKFDDAPELLHLAYVDRMEQTPEERKAHQYDNWKPEIVIYRRVA